MTWGYSEMYVSIFENMENGTYTSSTMKGSEKMAIGVVGMVGIGLWSIVDAVHVAKVNNMYYQDHYKRTSAINLEIGPYAEPVTMYNQVTVPVGLTLKATF